MIAHSPTEAVLTPTSPADRTVFEDSDTEVPSVPTIVPPEDDQKVIDRLLDEQLKDALAQAHAEKRQIKSDENMGLDKMPHQPDQDLPGRPELADQVKQKEPMVNEPEEPRPPQQDQDVPGQPGLPDQVKQEEPMVNKPGEPRPAQQDQDVPGQPGLADQVKQEEPMVNKPAQPDQDVPGQPGLADQVKQEEPMVNKPAQPDQDVPGQNVPGQPGLADQVKQEEPMVNKPAQPDQDVPGQPGLADQVKQEEPGVGGPNESSGSKGESGQNSICTKFPKFIPRPGNEQDARRRAFLDKKNARETARKKRRLAEKLAAAEEAQEKTDPWEKKSGGWVWWGRTFVNHNLVGSWNHMPRCPRLPPW